MTLASLNSALHEGGTQDPEVALLDTAHETDWTGFVTSHPLASPYHTLAWRDAIRKAFAHETHYLYAAAGARLTGVLPLVRLRSFLFGDYLVSLPFVNYGGAVADSVTVARSLMKGAAELAKRIGCRHIEFRDQRPCEGYPVRTDKVAMELDLPPSADALWSSLDSKRRGQIRRADKSGVRTTFGGVELLPEFYEVFARNMRDLGTPVYGQEFFSAVLNAFPETASIVLSRYRGKPVAAGLLVRHRDRMEIPWASAIREYNQYSVNIALYWNALQQAISIGCRVFDFGRSSMDSGTYRFKQQWGAKPRPFYWHYWLNEGVTQPQLTPNNPRYRFAIAAWQRLPLFIANRLGPVLVKNLP